MIKSKCKEIGTITLPHVDGETSMIPFNIQTLEGLPSEFLSTVKTMLGNIKSIGTAYFTIHGKNLNKYDTLRRGGPHTDGNYEPNEMSFGGGGGGGGWKIGENGPAINTAFHHRQYNNELGGIILATNFCSAIGWNGDYDSLPKVGGDCSHIDLGESFNLEAGKVYYGNNHFIHESLPISEDYHRVFARITMPETHKY